MDATPNTIEFIHDRWVPIAESPSAVRNLGLFWNAMPGKWQPFRESPDFEFVAHPDFNLDEDGNGTAYIAAHDKDRDLVFIKFFYNF